MIVERNLVISVLKMTKEGPALIEDVNFDAKIPSSISLCLLSKLQQENLVNLKGDTVDAESRIKLAVKAVLLGADIQRISDLLGWQEFEAITALALKNNGFTVQSNVRFKHTSRRWEIDVVGCKKPLVLCIDCKHWQRAITPSALRKMVDLQAQRTNALADLLPNTKVKLDCIKWEKAKFIPAVLSLIPNANKFIDNVPVVPVLQFQDFIYQLPAYTESVRTFPKNFKSISHDS